MAYLTDNINVKVKIEMQIFSLHWMNKKKRSFLMPVKAKRLLRDIKKLIFASSSTS